MKRTSSEGKSLFKVKKARGSQEAGGIVIPKGAIVVNQGLGKIKLEEDFVDQKPDLPISIAIEEDGSHGATSGTADVGGEAVTEEHVVIKVEADIPMSSEETPIPNEMDVYGSLSFCRDEIEALKGTVTQLALQMEKMGEENMKRDEVIKKQTEESKKRDKVIQKRHEENKKRGEEIKKLNEENKKLNEENKKLNEENKKLNEENKKRDEMIKKLNEEKKKRDVVIKKLNEEKKKREDFWHSAIEENVKFILGVDRKL